MNYGGDIAQPTLFDLCVVHISNKSIQINANMWAWNENIFN